MPGASKIINWYKTAIGGGAADYYDLAAGTKLLKLRSVYFTDTTRKLVSGAGWVYNLENDPGMALPAWLFQVHGSSGAGWEGSYNFVYPLVFRFVFYTTVAGDVLSIKILLEDA
jgi:hypothetical protein